LDARDLKSPRNIQGTLKESGDVILSGQFTPSLAKRWPARLHRAQIKRPFSSRSEWRWKILPRQCWCIERRLNLIPYRTLGHGKDARNSPYCLDAFLRSHTLMW
jgi:hypothetical protein